MNEYETQQAGEVKTLIPTDWTQESFITKTAFDWLWEQKENEDIFPYIMQKAKEKAEELGITKSTFNELWKKYEKTHEPEPKQQILGDFVTMFPEQPVQLRCGKYVCDQFGIAYTGRMGEEVEVCSHPIMPTARIYDVDNRIEQMEIAFTRNNAEWETLTEPKEVVFDSRKIVSLAKHGILVTTENSKELVKFLCALESANNVELPLFKKTSKLGWHGKKFVPFDDELTYISNDNSREFTECIHEQGDYSTWLNTIKKIRDDKEKHLPARMAIAASFASPLLSLISKLPFILHLRSTISSSCKTVALMAAASVWGDPDTNHKFARTANGTVNYFQFVANVLNNIPLFLDEIQTMPDKKRFSEFIYNLCEGKGRGRLTKNVSLSPELSWNLVTITTGEQSLSSDRDREGALARIVDVNVKEKILDDPYLFADALKENYGFAGKIFINAVLHEDLAGLKQEIAKTSKALQEAGYQDKQADSGAVILLADRLAEKHIFQDGEKLTIDEVKRYLKRKDETDMNRRVYEYICGWCTQYQNCFEFENNNYPKPYFGKKVSDTHYRILKEALKGELIRNGYDDKSFIEWCVNHEAIEDKNGRQARHNGGNPQWLLDFHIFDMDEGTDKAELKKAPEQPKPAEPVPVEVDDLPF